MRALDPEVVDAVWAAIEPLLPVRVDTHPLGCHRQRSRTAICFEVMLVRLVTGCSWEDAERLCGNKVSDTTVRLGATSGMMPACSSRSPMRRSRATTRSSALTSVTSPSTAVCTKALAGGEGTGKNPTDRAKLGWKWSILTDAQGIPIGWTIDGANRHDSITARLDPRRGRRRGLLEKSRRSGSTVVMTPRSPGSVFRDRHRRRSHRQEAQEATQSRDQESVDGLAVAGRADQFVALELRSARDATPTARPFTGSPSSLSPSPSCSQRSSSTGETAGHPPRPYPLRLLRKGRDGMTIVEAARSSPVASTPMGRSTWPPSWTRSVACSARNRSGPTPRAMQSC